MAKVRVKVAVAVDPDGDWVAGGNGDAHGKFDESAHTYCVDTLSPGERRYWLVAELDIPDSDEVEAAVELASEGE